MVTALYRRYRPENFAELIGQNQVTDPLRTALRTNRVNHAYLFSGPRGCGKTTSARILARCLNCAAGPTDTPCAVCPSCVELARDGSGSLDVIEIDAASHGGVEDSRDLRDRAIFAPARDRYKIFILDEAHMVTNQGFNALLKIIEEPPEHVKFIFATTEPEKVIGTIRSRTHHYPFRLVPPAQMLDYVGQLCETEGVEAAPGVLPLVVRAGGGSVRDTLSLLDQLMAGSETGPSGHVVVDYERAVALLGYTHASLLDGVVDSLGARDGAAAFAAVDRVVQTGQDPRRFVEDLLERLRDLIVVGATNEGAAAVLRGITADELDHLSRQAHAFGQAELSRSADVVNRALTDMTGATSPRLHLELMVARVLVPESDETERGALARVERLERRVGVSDGGPVSTGAPSAEGASGSTGGSPASSAPASRSRADPSPRVGGPAPVRATGAPSSSDQPSGPAGGAGGQTVDPAAAASAWAQAVPASAASSSTSSSTSTPSEADPVPDAPAVTPSPSPSPSASSSASFSASTPSSSAEAPSAEAPSDEGEPALPAAAHSAAWVQTPPIEGSVEPTPTGGVAGPVSLQQLRDAWPEILEAVNHAKLSAWMVVSTATVGGYRDDVLTLQFPSANDVELFKRPVGAGEGVSEFLRRAIQQVLGVRVKYIARVDEGAAGAHRASSSSVSGPAASTTGSAPSSSAEVPAASPSPVRAPDSTPAGVAQPAASSAGPTTGWAVAAIPQSAPAEAPSPASAGMSGADASGADVSGAVTAGANASGAGTSGAGATSYPEPEEPPFDEPDLPETITEEPPGGVPSLDAQPPRGAMPVGGAPDPGLSDSAAAARAASGYASTPAAARPALQPAPARSAAAGRGIPQTSRYGEAVVREILGAQFIHEEIIAPRVSPQSAEPTESS